MQRGGSILTLNLALALALALNLALTLALDCRSWSWSLPSLPIRLQGKIQTFTQQS